MKGMAELGEEIFHMPVRIGAPTYMGGLSDVVRNPRYSTAVGLLLEGRDQYLRQELARAQISGMQSVIERMKSWWKANF